MPDGKQVFYEIRKIGGEEVLRRFDSYWEARDFLDRCCGLYYEIVRKEP